jgi:hypothetical protein
MGRMGCMMVGRGMKLACPEFVRRHEIWLDFKVSGGGGNDAPTKRLVHRAQYVG